MLVIAVLVNRYIRARAMEAADDERAAERRCSKSQDVSKYFGSVIALKDISMSVTPARCMCLLGDNGAGKSHPDQDLLRRSSARARAASWSRARRSASPRPRDALSAGIATVYQDLAMIPLMSISRNFFLGSEPTVGWGPFRRFDVELADRVTREELAKMGIHVRDTEQSVGTLSGGERQSVAIARAVYFGAKVLILDEPTAALGVKEAGVVLRYIAQARARGLGVVFITHNVHHAYPDRRPLHPAQPRPLLRHLRQGRGHPRRGGGDDGRRRRAGGAGSRTGRIRPDRSHRWRQARGDCPSPPG